MDKNPKITHTLQFIRKYGPEKISVPARTVLLSEGEKAKRIYFVESGCLRMWFNHNGNAITTQFFFEGKSVASTESLLTGQPSDFSIEAIEDCVLYMLSREKFTELMVQDKEFSDWFNAFILDRFFYYSRHLLSYLKNKPQQRYNDLLKNNPQILQRVPQHYIASYLGITPVSLSRIRNRKEGS